MKPERYTAEMVERYTKMGYWGRPATVALWDRHAAVIPEREAMADSRSRLTWAEVKRWTDRVALGLLELGFQRDDVILMQLPNMVEMPLVLGALQKAGLLVLPLMMYFRHSEVAHALELTGARGMVLVPQFGGFDYLEMAREITPRVPSLKHVFAVGESVPPDCLPLAEMGRQPQETKYPADRLRETVIRPGEVLMLRMTSGTTGFPKFSQLVADQMHFVGECNAARWQVTGDDTLAAFSPAFGGPSGLLTFFTGSHVGARMVFLERFEAEEALKLIQREQVTLAGGVPAQLIQMLRHPSFSRYDLSSLRAFVVGGSALPYYLAQEAEDRMECRIVGQLGMSDIGSIASTLIESPAEVRRMGAGRPYPGTEVRLVDEAGREVPPGEIGEITVRGATIGPGYYQEPEKNLEIFGGEADGFFHTGDLGKLDDQGNLYIVGRRKDVIIRGGQNIYPVEVENLLLTHPKVHDVAIVAMPDPIMGEKACAYLIPRPGETVTLQEVVSFLREKKIAPYKLPERLEVVGEFPMSGDGQKVSKIKLTEQTTRKLRDEGKL